MVMVLGLSMVCLEVSGSISTEHVLDALDLLELILRERGTIGVLDIGIGVCAAAQACTLVAVALT